MQASSENQELETPFLLTIEETIKGARTSRATIYREIKAGRLKTVKIGSRRYTTPEFVKEWIAGLSDSEAA